MMNSYPLKDDPEAHLRAASGRPLADVTLDGPFEIGDLTIRADTLQAQAEVARREGYSQLAENLSRAAELTRVPDALLLRIYTLLRPKRASYTELGDLADRLEQEYQAADNARFIREAAKIYRARGLLRPE